MSRVEFTSTSFYGFLDEGKLLGSQCKSCGEKYLPPRPICVNCNGREMEWIEFSKEGTLKAFTIIHIAPTEMIEAGYGRENPYCSGIAQLDDGPAISAQILGADVNAPSDIKIGSRLHLVVKKRGKGENEKSYLAFQLSE
jgi:uncharacterized OB-fold protein